MLGCGICRRWMRGGWGNFGLGWRLGCSGAGMKLVGEDGADAIVDVSVAENLREVIFAAEVRRGGNEIRHAEDAREVAIVSLDRDDAVAVGETRARVTLQRETIWSQRETDFGFLDCAGGGGCGEETVCARGAAVGDLSRGGGGLAGGGVTSVAGCAGAEESAGIFANRKW